MRKNIIKKTNKKKKNCKKHWSKEIGKKVFSITEKSISASARTQELLFEHPRTPEEIALMTSIEKTSMRKLLKRCREEYKKLMAEYVYYSRFKLAYLDTLKGRELFHKIGGKDATIKKHSEYLERIWKEKKK